MMMMMMMTMMNIIIIIIIDNFYSVLSESSKALYNQDNKKKKFKIIISRTKTFFDLERKDYVKYLGVIIDQHLSWKHHINYIALKIRRNIWNYFETKTLCPFKNTFKYLQFFNFSQYILRPHCLGPSFQISFRKISYTPKESCSLDQHSANDNALLKTFFNLIV